MECSIPTCPKPARARGWCHSHYIKFWWRVHNAEHEKQIGWRNHLLRKYGLTEDDYQQLLETQEGQCAICQAEIQLHVDHDDTTKIVRGLLCGKCNRGIGMFNHDIELLEAAIAYLAVIDS